MSLFVFDEPLLSNSGTTEIFAMQCRPTWYDVTKVKISNFIIWLEKWFSWSKIMRFLPMTIIFTCDVTRRRYDVINVELLVPNFGSKQSFLGIIKYEDIENYE